LFGVEISLHFGGFLILLLPAFLFQVSKMLVRRGERWKGNVANLATVFSSTIGLSVNQIVATCLQTANVVVDLDGRAQLQSHVADDVVSLHQQQGRTVDFLPIGKKGKKRKNKKVRK
jgi:predicted amidohydrolase